MKGAFTNEALGNDSSCPLSVQNKFYGAAALLQTSANSNQLPSRMLFNARDADRVRQFPGASIERGINLV